MLGLAIFVRYFGWTGHPLAGALTLSLMIIPMAIIASPGGDSAVPTSLRDGRLPGGWRDALADNPGIRTLPQAMPG